MIPLPLQLSRSPDTHYPVNTAIAAQPAVSVIPAKYQRKSFVQLQMIHRYRVTQNMKSIPAPPPS